MLTIGLSLGSLMALPVAIAAPSEPQPCPVGTVIDAKEAPETDAAFRSLSARLKYRTTLHFAASAPSCSVHVEGFDPNSAVARLKGGGYFWNRGGTAPVRIAADLSFVEKGITYDPATRLKGKRRCDPQAIDSSTYGPFGSCVALYRGKQGFYLRVRSARGGAEAEIVRLPATVRYVAIDAGDWAHDVGGEIALIRAPSGSAVVDVYMLMGG